MPKRTGISEAPLQDPTNRNKSYLVPVLVTETGKESTPGAMSIETIALYSRAGANANPGTGAAPADLTAEAQIRFDQDTLLRNSILTLNTNINGEVDTRHSEDLAIIASFQTIINAQRADIDENAGDITRERNRLVKSVLIIQPTPPTLNALTNAIRNTRRNESAYWLITEDQPASGQNPQLDIRIGSNGGEFRDVNGNTFTPGVVAMSTLQFAAGTLIRFRTLGNVFLEYAPPAPSVISGLLARLTGNDRLPASAIRDLPTTTPSTSTGRLFVGTQEPSATRQATLLANATDSNPAIWFIPYRTGANRVNQLGAYTLANDNVQVRDSNGREITNARLATGLTNFAAGTIIRLTALNTYQIVGGQPSAEITATLLNRLTENDRITANSISGLRRTILNEIEGTHPIIVSRRMPTAEVRARTNIYNNDFPTTLWIVANDQRTDDNIAGFLIDNPTGRGALADGTPIPTVNTDSTTILLRAGTILRPREPNGWRVVSAPATTAEIVTELELASGDDRLASSAIKGLKAGVRESEPNIHPIITSKAMPTVAQSTAARGSGASEGHAIWIINEDQAATDNRGAATIINDTGKGALVNGLVIPPSTNPASSLQLQAGTMLRIGTNDAYEIIWAPPVAGSGQTPTTTSTATSTVIAQMDMPTEATLQAIINNLPEHGIGLWVVTANQTDRANRANARINAPIRGLALANGTEIPETTTDSSFLSFRSGTVLSFRTTTAFNVVSAEKTITSIRDALAALVGDRRIPASAISGVIDYSINSPQLEFPLNGNPVSWAHGLTTPPTQIFAKAVCLIANHGYAFGDEVQITPHNVTKSNLWADATNITLMNFDIEMQSKATNSRFFPGSTAQAGITNGQWRVVLTGLL